MPPTRKLPTSEAAIVGCDHQIHRQDGIGGHPFAKHEHHEQVRPITPAPPDR